MNKLSNECFVPGHTKYVIVEHCLAFKRRGNCAQTRMEQTLYSTAGHASKNS